MKATIGNHHLSGTNREVLFLGDKPADKGLEREKEAGTSYPIRASSEVPFPPVGDRPGDGSGQAEARHIGKIIPVHFAQINIRYFPPDHNLNRSLQEEWQSQRAGKTVPCPQR